MSKGAFPFKAARPKEVVAAPPPLEVQFDPPVEHVPDADIQEEIEKFTQPIEQEEDLRKAKRGRPPKPVASNEPKFTFAEVAAIFGEDVPFVRVIAKIVPVIEVLNSEERKRVIEILGRLYG